jgi:hypothetical protein
VAAAAKTRTRRPSSSGTDVEFADRLTLLNELVSYKVDDLLDRLGVRLRRQGKKLAGACPVHGGGRQDAFNLYPEGHTMPGVWVCRSRGCHKVFKQTLVGFTRGVLSQQEGWEPGGKKPPVPMSKAIAFVCEVVGQKWDAIKADAAAAERKRFVSEVTTYRGYVPQVKEGWDVRDVRKRLECPSPYFLGRGFSAEILDRFSVGDALIGDSQSPMYRRAVVPVFDKQGRVVGTTGRSLLPPCSSCGRHHDPADGCPAEECRRLPQFAKWRNTPGFAKEHHLFNFWGARPAIQKRGKVALVEGPPDVLKLVQAGCENAVALFGVDLNDPQLVLLEMSGAMEVVLLLDPDKGGDAGTETVAETLRRSGFRVSIPRFDEEPGDMSDERVRQDILPLLGG